MKIRHTTLEGVFVFEPTVHRDERGFFTRTFDHDVAAGVGINGADFVQDSQSRSHRGVVRGMHLRTGDGEAKLVRCARGRILDVLVDARVGSMTFGSVLTVELDDIAHAVLHVPRGVAHGWQALTDEADVCYRIDARHDPTEDVTFRHDDPELAIPWPLPVALLSQRDREAPSWAEVTARLRSAR